MARLEMCAYRLHGHSRAVAAGLGKAVVDAQDEGSDLLAAVVNDIQAEAGANLYAVLAAFAKHYEVDVTVNGASLAGRTPVPQGLCGGRRR